MISDNTEDTSKSGNIKMFKYKQLKNGYCLPIEIIILLNKFQSIKKINLSIEGIEKEKNQIYNYLIILFNIEWLFPNAIEIELNLKNNELQNTIREIVDMITDKIFQKAKLLNKTTNYSKSNNNYKTKVPITCPKCGSMIALIDNGSKVGCSKYPQCNYVVWKDN